MVAPFTGVRGLWHPSPSWHRPPLEIVVIHPNLTPAPPSQVAHWRFFTWCRLWHPWLPQGALPSLPGGGTGAPKPWSHTETFSSL